MTAAAKPCRVRVGQGNYDDAKTMLVVRAQNDALRAYIADLPDPREFAYAMSDDEVLAFGAVRGQGATAKALPQYQAMLANMGLVDVRTGLITAFGIKVRRSIEDRP